ncbi:hypothetical protein F0562_019515 [Nyssa sinensis]|uniref:Exocyst component Exo84 C-terminal domain-containing protein n=1 Tax=Nyssa sinensis TaxID=561372 RepID=A0A5J5BU28_9ASTE|nr:hypothetical protein F0562_019515 [Nyssa sinensis]
MCIWCRLSEEVVEMEHELNELRKHISAQRILVQDLLSGACHELDEWNQALGDIDEAQHNSNNCELEDPLPNEAKDHKTIFLENIDILLAEHKVDEAIEAIDSEERFSQELKGSGDTSCTEPSSYKSAFLKRKAMLEEQLVEITEQPSVSILELKKAFSGLLKLGKGPLAHQLLLKLYESRLQKSTKAFLPLPYIEEVLELNFRRARKVVLDFAENDESLPLSPRFASPLSSFATSSASVLIHGGMRFISVVKDIVEQLTPLVILHFGGNVLTRISQLFDKYVDALIKALPGPLEDDNLAELKEVIVFRVETDSEQLALLGTAFTVAEELLPMVVSRVWSTLNESKEAENGLNENIVPTTSNTIEFKDWRRHLQHSLDKLRDHFCRQYVLNFIYSRDGKTRLNAQIYLNGKGEDLFWDSDPLPSLPFQALFGKLQQLATVAGDVLLGKEKIQKILLARLTETVIMWLSDEQEFWGVLEDDSAPLQPLGLQQLILDMHFTVEIARFAGYPSRHVHQIASAIIARAIRTFSARGIDPQSALPEDEWFVETAKAAINKLLLGTSGSDTSEIDEEHIIHDEDISDSEESPSSLSTVDTFESFASADMGEIESPMHFTDPEG